MPATLRDTPGVIFECRG